MQASKKRKTDRRTLYTICIIKDTFLKLFKKECYNKVTITQICKEADKTRSTFYLHFNSITDVLNEVLDDALSLAEDTGIGSQIDGSCSINYLKQNESLIPACQRVGNSEKYQRFLMDPDLSEYII